MRPEIIEALAWALIHFTWQGALIALAAALACETLRASRPGARYAVLVLALAVMAVTPVVTTVYLLGSPEIAALPARAGVTEATSVTAPLTALSPTVAAPLPSPPSGEGWLAALVACWSGIAAFLSLRSFGGWLKVQRLARRRVSPVSWAIERSAADLRLRLGIDRAVRVVHSSLAEVPGVVGWLKPVILLPVSLATALTPEQIEQILAHELAHVRRHDYLVNLFQTAVENVLFYHPAVWWISRRVRIERENCCDDLAVATCGDPIAYARTLARLETMRGTAPALLPAASGGALLSRVRRLVGQDPSRRTVPAWFGAVVPLAIVALALASVPAPEADADIAEEKPAPVAVPASEVEPEAKSVPAPVAAPSKPAPAPAPAPDPQPKRESRPSDGYLAGLTDAGYTHISVEDIIRLKHNGVGTRFIKRMLEAGLGPLDPDQLIRLYVNGVTPEYAATVVQSGLAKGLDVENMIQLRHSGVDAERLRRIRGLGFGPYPVADIIRLQHNGVDASTFEALKELGTGSVEDAIRFRQYGVTVQTIREAQRQGFSNLSAEQILKLRQGGII